MKIFVSVGTRFPMDRLVADVDDYLVQHPGDSGVGQVGDSSYQPERLTTKSWFTLEEFREQVRAADVFVSHAGIGNLILASELQRPLVIVPRRAELGEHINDHQISTASAFANRPAICVVDEGSSVDTAIDWARDWDASADLQAQQPGSGLLDALTNYVEEL